MAKALSAKQEEETALSPEERAKKKRRETPFHEHYVRPMSFLEDAVRLGTSEFNLAGPNKPFGENQEAYARASYEEIVHTINRKRIQFLKSNIRAMAFIIRGSSGVGKSAFLGYAISRFRKFMPTIVIFHAPKIAKLGYIIELSAVQVSIWVGGKEQSRGVYPQMVDQVTKIMTCINLIVMDGCSVTMDLLGFKGMILVAASPCLYLKNIADAIFDHEFFTMPAVEAEEAKIMAAMIGVDEDIMMENSNEERPRRRLQVPRMSFLHLVFYRWCQCNRLQSNKIAIWSTHW
jgi:hypothetical protein